MILHSILVYFLEGVVYIIERFFDLILYHLTFNRVKVNLNSDLRAILKCFYNLQICINSRIFIHSIRQKIVRYYLFYVLSMWAYIFVFLENDETRSFGMPFIRLHGSPLLRLNDREKFC